MLERFSCLRRLSILVINVFRLIFCSADICFKASKNSFSILMLVACLPAIKTDFLSIIFYDSCQKKLFERHRKRRILVRRKMYWLKACFPHPM